MTPHPDFVSNFDYLKLHNVHLYNMSKECEDFYHFNPKVPIVLMRAACERLLHDIVRHKNLRESDSYIHNMTMDELNRTLLKRSCLTKDQNTIIDMIRLLGNSAAHGDPPPRFSNDHKFFIKEAAAPAIFDYEQSWKRSLSQIMTQIFFDLTKSIADVAGYPPTSKEFEEPPDIFRKLRNNTNLMGLEIKNIKKINADLEKSQLNLAIENRIFKEGNLKQKKLYQLWTSSNFDRKNYLREISSFRASVNHDPNVLPRIKKWLHENPTEILAATKEQHRIAKEQWLESDKEAKQIAKEQSDNINKLQTHILTLQKEGIRYQNWVTEYPVELPNEVKQTLWQRRSDFFKERLINMQPPFEEYFGIPQQIGKGGWGTAYKCSPKEGVRYVAKIVRGDLQEHSKIEHIEKVWQKEAQIATKLTLLDKRIAGIAYPIREGDPNHLGFTMYEYIEGVSLSTYLNRKPVPLPKALLWSTIIADTVFDLREERIWFTDLGFKNIIIRGGMPVLIDPTPLQPGNSSWPPEWSSDENINLFSNDFIPASGQLFQLAWLLLNMISPQISKKANYSVANSSACSIRGQTPMVDERDLNENNKQTVRNCVSDAIGALPQKHRDYITDRKKELVDCLIACIDINPDRRKKYCIEDFKTLLLSFFDPFGVFQSTY